MRKLSLAALLCAAVSCSDNIDQDITIGAELEQLPTTKVDASANLSRFSVDSEGATSWDATDELGLFHSKSTNAQFTYDEGTFSGELVTLDTPETISAIFPYDADATLNDGIYTYTFSNVQQMNQADKSFLYGVSSSTWSNESDLAIELSPLTSYVEVTITNVPEGVGIQGVQLQPTPNKVYDINVNLTTGDVTRNVIDGVTYMRCKAGDRSAVFVSTGTTDEITFKIYFAGGEIAAGTKWAFNVVSDESGTSSWNSPTFTYPHTFENATTIPAGNRIPIKLDYQTQWKYGEDKPAGDYEVVDGDTTLQVNSATIDATALSTIATYFSDNETLTTLDLSSCSADGVSFATFLQTTAPSIEYLIMPSNYTFTSNKLFEQITRTITMEFPGDDITLIKTNSFTGSTGVSLILSGVTSVPTIENSASVNYLAGVQVPAELVDDFYTGWSVAAALTNRDNNRITAIAVE